MSWWAVGAAGVGIVTSLISGNKSSSAIEGGADSAAAAQIESTRLQIEESRRQFDLQMSMLMPALQQQYNAQGVFGDLLGLGGTTAPAGTGVNAAVGPSPGTSLTVQPDGTVRPGATGGFATAGPTDGQQFIGGSQTNAPPPIDAAQWPRTGQANEQQIREAFQVFLGREPTQQEMQYYHGSRKHPRMNQLWEDVIQGGVRSDANTTVSVEDRQAQWNQAATDANPTFGRTNQGFAPTRNEAGAFVDPNRDPTQQGDVVRADPLAGPIEDDLLINRSQDVRNAAGTYQEDPLFDYATGTFLTSDVFEESPGYAFQVEEMERAFERRNSAGGNYGGRAVIEAQRRRQGLAAGDYYNWAQLRQQDLGRADRGIESWLGRRGVDISRGDVAYGARRDRMSADVGRRDQAALYDQARLDEGYQNYLNNVARAAGYGGSPINSAVAASGAAGAQVSGAYAQQGGSLASIYGNLGAAQGANAYNTGANVNNAITSGIENYMFYDYLRNQNRNTAGGNYGPQENYNPVYP